MKINGKTYPLWGQFVEQKDKWIGGILHDTYASPTEITDITLTPNGTDSAVFSVIGKDYTCASDVRYLGLASREDSKPGFLLCGYGGHQFTIQPK